MRRGEDREDEMRRRKVGKDPNMSKKEKEYKNYLSFWSALRHALIRSLASSETLGALVSLAGGNST